MKTCSVCKVPKSLDQFNKKAGRQDGLQGKCRECSRKMSKAHYDANPGYYQAKNHHTKEKLAAAIKQLKLNPCMDCGGVFHPVAMDFDHREGSAKVGSIASLVRQSGWSIQRVLEEVAKCDLVCANCHRVRTYNRLEPGEGYVKSEKRFW